LNYLGLEVKVSGLENWFTEKGVGFKAKPNPRKIKSAQ